MAHTVAPTTTRVADTAALLLYCCCALTSLQSECGCLRFLWWMSRTGPRNVSSHSPSHHLHDEDERDDGEEEAVDVDVGEVGRRLIGPLLALSFPMRVRSLQRPG